MVTLKANHQSLTANTEFSYLLNNETSGVAAATGVVVINSNIFAANDFVLLGEWGSETAEILKINTVTASTHTVKFTAATIFAHSESTRITVIKYDQVNFYRTTTATFSSSSSLSGYVNIQPDDFTTNYHDLTNDTGFGWYRFYNSHLATHSGPSNAIPYLDFSEDSVKKIFDQFNSLLNNKEVSLISSMERFSWLNEAYSRAQNELNLINQAYTVPTSLTITTVSGTAETALPSDFGRLISITDSDGLPVPKVKLKDEKRSDIVSNKSHYYLRGTNIGFSPTPTTADVYDAWYAAKATKLTSLYNSVSLPNNNFYFLCDWMMFRASQKLKKTDNEKMSYKNGFEDGLKTMKITSVSQNVDGDSWEISQEASV